MDNIHILSWHKSQTSKYADNRTSMTYIFVLYNQTFKIYWWWCIPYSKYSWLFAPKPSYFPADGWTFRNLEKGIPNPSWNLVEYLECLNNYSNNGILPVRTNVTAGCSCGAGVVTRRTAQWFAGSLRAVKRRRADHCIHHTGTYKHNHILQTKAMVNIVHQHINFWAT